MGNAHIEHIDGRLDARFPDEQIRAHVYGGHKCIALQNSPGESFALRTSGVFLNQYSGFAPAHLRKRLLHKNHSLAGRRIGRIQQEYIGREFFVAKFPLLVFSIELR